MLWGYILLLILLTHGPQTSVFAYSFDLLISDHSRDHLIGPKPSRTFHFGRVPCYPASLCLDLESRHQRPGNFFWLSSLLSCDGTGQSWNCTWRESNPISRPVSYWNKVTVVLETSLGDGSDCYRAEPWTSSIGGYSVLKKSLRGQASRRCLVSRRMSSGRLFRIKPDDRGPVSQSRVTTLQLPSLLDVSSVERVVIGIMP